jgi:hypothetical protein
MPEDCVGERFRPFRAELLKFLSVRNESLLAHGIQPVSERHFKLHSRAITKFIDETIDLAAGTLNKKRKIPATQFPTTFGYVPHQG